MLYLRTATPQILSHPCNCIGIVHLPEKADALVDFVGNYSTLSGFGLDVDKGE